MIVSFIRPHSGLAAGSDRDQNMGLLTTPYKFGLVRPKLDGIISPSLLPSRLLHRAGARVERHLNGAIDQRTAMLSRTYLRYLKPIQALARIVKGLDNLETIVPTVRRLVGWHRLVVHVRTGTGTGLDTENQRSVDHRLHAAEPHHAPRVISTSASLTAGRSNKWKPIICFSLTSPVV